MLARDVIKTVANRTGVPVSQIKGSRGTPAICDARHMCQWIIYRRLGYSYLRTARLFGRINHTSVIHAVRKIDRLRKVRDDIREITDEAVS